MNTSLPRYFSVDASHPYFVTVSAFNNIEDVEGDFVTEVELRQIYGNACCRHATGPVVHVNEQKVKDELEQLMAIAVAEGKKSVTVNDDLATVINDHLHVSYLVPGLVRGGGSNRFRISSPTERKAGATTREINSVVARVILGQFIRREFGIEVKSVSDKHTLLCKVKKYFTLHDVTSSFDRSAHGRVTDVHMERLTEVWDNPDLWKPKAKKPVVR